MIRTFGVPRKSDGRLTRILCYHCLKPMRAERGPNGYSWQVDCYPLCGHDGGRYVIGHEEIPMWRRREMVEELRRMILDARARGLDPFSKAKARALLWRTGNVVPAHPQCNNLRCTVGKRCSRGPFAAVRLALFA